MKLTDFKDKKVVIFGLGLSGGGVGAAKFFYRAGAKVTVTDIKTKEELEPSVKKLEGFKDIKYVFGQHRSEDFTNADLIVKSPAIPWKNPYLKLAAEKNIPIEMDSSLFMKLCPAKIIGVTGTKGKTTTSVLIYEILKSAGLHPIKVGIDQVSVLEALSEIKKDDIAVFEMSSWRLSALRKDRLSPQIAVITNILNDHLNYYDSMEKYIADKKNIFLFQKPGDLLVINWDDPLLREISQETPVELVKVSAKDSLVDGGVRIEGGMICYFEGGKKEEIIDVNDIGLKGKHNIKNIMLAIAATKRLGVKTKHYQEVIKLFKGMPHRLEFVLEIKGVKYYNDSAATIPDAAIQAVKSFLNPVILICGGADKNLNFNEFAKTILADVKGVIFLKGSATEKLTKELKNQLDSTAAEKGFEIVDSMKKAVEIASRSAETGDVVLLSPGAASFGLFKNEFDRGNQFKSEVESLKKSS